MAFDEVAGMAILRTLLIALLAALPAAAEAPAWRFKAGEKLVFSCKAEYTFTQTRVKDGKEIFCSAPQVEEMTLQATVLATGDDGAARIEFEVLAEKIDSTWADTGIRAVWDSATDKDVCPGFERYAVIFGHKFTALIGPDGAIRETKNAAWPKTCPLPCKERTSKGERSAAETTRDPTTPQGWLELIFGSTPQDKASWKRTWDLPDAEEFDAKAAGSDHAGGASCIATAFETAPKQPGGVEVPPEHRRKGKSSFSAATGRMMRVELQGAEEARRYKPGKYGRIAWNVELKKVVPPEK